MSRRSEVGMQAVKKKGRKRGEGGGEKSWSEEGREV